MPLTRDPRRHARVIETDLNFVLEHWREPSFDIWEEEQGQHYTRGFCTMRRSPMALFGCAKPA